MDEDPLETVLRLVAEGRLTAEEASPILEALDAGQRPKGSGPGGQSASDPGSSWPLGTGAPGPGPDFAPGPGPGFAPGPGPGFAPGPGPSLAFGAGPSGRSVRIEVREEGRSVVNL